MPHVDGVDDGVGYGVKGRSTHYNGVTGYSEDRAGLYGRSDSGDGVYGTSENGYGMAGYSYNGYGVYSFSNKSHGVYGESLDGDGVDGKSYNGTGVYGESTKSHGVYGKSLYGDGVRGLSYESDGVNGESTKSHGVYGKSLWGDGVRGLSYNGYAVHGLGYAGDAVVGWSETGAGVVGESAHFDGVRGRSYSGAGLYGASRYSYAALLQGNVRITAGDLRLWDHTLAPVGSGISGGNLRIDGHLSKSSGSFKIDHPLDPANKYLSHSFVESPDMKNIYDGVIVLDSKGEAKIELPEWFGALNKDFRYQLTAIGAPGPNLYIAEEISDAVTNSSNNSSSDKSRFKVAGGTPGMKVSWHVTGIRKDPWANAHRIQVEEDKPEKERGYYIHPELYNQPAKNGMNHLLAPKVEKELLINEKPSRRQSR